MYCKLDKFNIISNLPAIHFENKWIWCYVNKTEANLALTNVLAARCVRVIHAQCVLQFALLSRTLLRSSSNNEPSDPPYRIIFVLFFCICIYSIHIQWQTTIICWMERFKTSHNFSREILWLAIYIMVRHNHHTYTIYIYVRSCEVKFCFMIDEINHRTVMIHTQVHLRIPCYDFYFL